MFAAHALFLLAPALAPPPPAEEPPEIVVTGERQERRLRDTAASVTVIGGEDVDKQPAADRLESLLPLVPNIQLGSGGEAPAIRGQDTTGVLRDLPAFLGGTRPRTTLQIDGRPAEYWELVFGLASMWDVDRVELFRSPQTITQGRNAIAGAIFVSTADPTFEPEGKARLIASTGGRRQASAAVGAPLIGNTLAFRLSADLGRDRPNSEIVDSMIGAGPNIDKQWLVRAKLLARPTPDLRLELGYTRSHSQMPQVEGIRAPFLVRRDPEATYGVFGSWINAVTGEGAWTLNDRLRSTTTITFSKPRFRRYAPKGLGQANIRKTVWTGEEVVRWTATDRLSLLGGLHLLKETTDQAIDIGALVGFGSFDDRQSSVGLFGEAEWKATSSLTLAAALRHQSDRQDRDGAIVGPSRTFPLDYRGRFNAWLPRATLTWTVNDALTLGLLSQKASNPGGSTLLLNGVVDSFDAETLWDHELFARGAVARGKLRWSANLFVQRFRNAQRPQSIEVAVPVGPPLNISQLDNAPRAVSRGLEAELDWRPSARLRLKGALGLLDTKITRTLSAKDPILGRQFQRAPHVSGSAAIEWRPLQPLMIMGQVRGRGRYFSDDANTPSRQVGAGAIIDGRVGWDFGDTTLSAYVRNLADRYQFTYYFSSTLRMAEDPRDVGIELSRRF